MRPYARACSRTCSTMLHHARPPSTSTISTSCCHLKSTSFACIRSLLYGSIHLISNAFHDASHAVTLSLPLVRSVACSNPTNNQLLLLDLNIGVAHHNYSDYFGSFLPQKNPQTTAFLKCFRLAFDGIRENTLQYRRAKSPQNLFSAPFGIRIIRSSAVLIHFVHLNSTDPRLLI